MKRTAGSGRLPARRAAVCWRGAAGPVFGVSVPVAVSPSLRLPAPVVWARAA